MTEIWKDITGYEGYYQVSNLGRIRSLDRYVFNGQAYYLVKGSIKVLRHNNWGYCQVKLSKGDKTKMFLVHRLVASAFIPNPDNLPCVNHIDEDKTNNCVDNLEWCSIAYNNAYNGLNSRRVSVTATARPQRGTMPNLPQIR